MQFFVPQAKRKPDQEALYQTIRDSLKDQLRWPITGRRIFSLSYTHDKKEHTLSVGQLEPFEHRYEVLAILESNVYLVFTRTLTGEHGVTILVNKEEVASIEDFAEAVA